MSTSKDKIINTDNFILQIKNIGNEVSDEALANAFRKYKSFKMAKVKFLLIIYISINVLFFRLFENVEA